MAWIILAFISVSTCFAQPVNGPYEIVAVAAPTALRDAKVFFVNDSVAGVCYAEGSGSSWVVKMVSANVRSGAIVAEPTTVFTRESAGLQIHDAALDANGEPIALAVSHESQMHYLHLIQRVNGQWTTTILHSVQDQFLWPCGLSQGNIRGAQFVLADSEVIQVAAYEIGIACPGFPEPYSRPLVCFYRSPTEFNTILMWEAEGFDWVPSLRAYAITPDSVHVWVNGFQWFNSRLAVNSSGEYAVLASYECMYADLAGMRIAEDTFIHVIGSLLCVPPCLVFQRISGDSCVEIAEVRLNDFTHSASVYEDHGFVFPTFDDLHVELARVDTAGIIAATTGTIAWRSEGAQIEEALTDVSTSGTIAALYREHSGTSGVSKLWLASCDWLTPLGSRDAPAPVPNEFTLTTYPNPFNAAVRIDYELPSTTDVRLSIFNTLGQEVVMLVNERVTAGAHSLPWSPTGASGVYLVRLVSNDFETSKKVLYLR